MTTKTKLIIGAVIAVLLLTIVTGFFIGRHNQRIKDTEIVRLANENQTFVNIITKNKEYITQQDQRIVTLQMAKDALLINVEELKAKGIKDVSVIVKLNTEITRLKLEASYTEPPVIIHDEAPVHDAHGIPQVNDYLKLPQNWKFEDKWLNIDGTIRATGVIINKLVNYSEPSVTLGYSKKFLKKPVPIVVFEDKNPYNVVKDMSNVVIINEPPFYKKPWFYMMEGVAVTIVGAWTVNQLK